MMMINPYSFGEIEASDDWNGLSSPNTRRWIGDVGNASMSDLSGSYAGQELQVTSAGSEQIIVNRLNTASSLDYRLYVQRIELESEPSGNPDADYVNLYFPGGTLSYSSNLSAMGNDGALIFTATGETAYYLPSSWPNIVTFQHIWIERSSNTITFKTGNATYASASTRSTATSTAIGNDTTYFGIGTVSADGSNHMGFMTDYLITDLSGNPLYI